jgi:MFS transporter, Spinster family, sphingosine-1-phosphate transporter
MTAAVQDVRAAAAGAAGPEPLVTSRTWVFVVFLMLLNVLNILDRQLLPTFANDIKADLQLSNAQFGLLSGIMFTLLYGLLSPFMGLVADTVHRPRFAAFGVALWSLLTAASGAARGFVSLAIPRIFIGVGEATLTPTALSMVADRFPARSFGLASGLYYAGVPLGAGLAFFVAATLGVSIGWRNCFFLIGGSGLVLAAIMAVQPDHRPRPARGDAGAGVRGMLALIPELFAAMKRSPALPLTIMGGVGVHFAVGGAQFDTLWWKEELGLDIGPLFLNVALMYATVGVAGNIIGGLASDWWLKVTGQGRPMFVVLVLVLLTPVQFLYRLTDDAGLIFWLGVGTGIFQLAAMYGAAYATIQELSPARIRATAVAMFIMAVNVIGLGVSVTVGGFMVDAFAAAGRARPITDMMLVMTAASCIAIPCFLLAALRFRKDREALAAYEAGRG